MSDPGQQVLQICAFPKMNGQCLTTLFQHFAANPWAMLLDSANSEHNDGRYQILVADPVATIITKGDTSTLWQAKGNLQQTSTDCPISLLEQVQSRLLPHIAQTSLPFAAGALGYFAYDLGRRFETLPNQAANPYQAPDMAVGLYSWSVINDTQNQQCWLCYLSDYPHPDLTQLTDLLTRPPKTAPDFALQGNWQSNLTKNQYLQGFNSIQAHLQAGDCYQVNFAQRFHAQYQGDEWQAYLRLRQANRAPFSAFIRLPEQSILSLSPERFLQVKGSRVQSKPIKGTRPRSADALADQAQAQALQASEKDRAENLMIVDLLRNDLSRNCQPGSIEVPQLFAIESFPAVHHLVSTVTGTLADNSHPLGLLRDAFPGGSITGAPKIRAMQIIDELEPDRRNIYCGSIGYLGLAGDMDTSICIRTLLCENGQIYCWAGGGIVLDSRGDAEYQESLDKVAKILPQLAEPTTGENEAN